ncbi:MAG: NAD(+) diphosphatase [Maricaulaceae bacterium]
MPCDPLIAFAGAPLDRCAPKRKDRAWVAEQLAHPQARAVVLHEGDPFILTEGAPGFVNQAGLAALTLAEPGVLLLGRDGVGPVLAAPIASREDFPLAPFGAFENMRAAATRLEPQDAALLGHAKSLLGWHAKHLFCAVCGAPTELAEGGAKRSCPACGADHFPRVDPVVIMAIIRGDNVLLGRQNNWPAGMYSCLAGFVEPGETLEEACRRESFEEAGVRIGAVRYALSQPWPFPSSLMVGLMAETEDRTVSLDDQELEDARWFARAEARALLAQTHPVCSIPPPLAIAHQLIKQWALG